MAFDDVTSGLRGFIMPPLVQWWKDLRAEHSHLYQQTAALQGQLRKLDKEIGKKRCQDGPAAKVDQKIRKRKNMQHMELEAVQWHLHSVQRSLRSFDKTLTAAIEAYARASCQALTAGVHSALPRELRDMVYDHLVDDDDEDHLGRIVRWQVEQLSSAAPQGDWASVFAVQHFVDPSFAPPAVCAEILQVASARCSRRHVLERAISRAEVRALRLQIGPLVINELAELEAFCSLRALDLDVLASDFFRHVEVSMNFRKMFETWKRTEGLRINDIVTPEWIAYLRRVLLSIPVRADRVVTVELHQYGLSDAESDAALRALEPAVWEMKAKGFQRVDCYNWVWVNPEDSRLGRERQYIGLAPA